MASPALLLCIMLSAGGTAATSTAPQSPRVSGWRNLKWGMSRAQAETAMGPGVNLVKVPESRPTPDRISYGAIGWQEPIAGSRVLVELSFWKERLLGVGLHPLDLKDINDQARWAEVVADLLASKYGRHGEERNWITVPSLLLVSADVPLRLWRIDETAIRIVVKKTSDPMRRAPVVEYLDYEQTVKFLEQDEDIKIQQRRREADKL